MNYAAAAGRFLPPQAASKTQAFRPPTISAPPPVHVPAEVEDDVEDDVVEEKVVDEDVDVDQVDEDVEVDETPAEELELAESTSGGGPFDWVFDTDALNDVSLKVLVTALGPDGVTLLARTCRYLFRAVFTSSKPLWSYLSLPDPSEVNVRFFIDTSLAEEGQKENIQNIPISQLRSEYQKNQLVKFWLRSVSAAHAAREKQVDQLKKDDPLTSDNNKGSLKVVLKGGFTISTKNDKVLVKLNDLSQVVRWLESLFSLIKGTEKSVNLPLEDGSVTLSRVGRGGSLLSVTAKRQKSDKENAIFDFGTFSEQIRKTAKEYFNIVGSCRTKLKKPQQVTQPQAFPQIESFIERVLEHDKLHQVLKNIKNSLTYGAIPHSTLPAYFKRKLQEKAQKHKQATSENGSIVNYLLSNLPHSLEDTKRARDALEIKIKQQIVDEFNERKNVREERWKKEREDKAARAELENEVAEKAGGGSGKKTKKDKKEKEEKNANFVGYKLVKQMGDDGFETLVKIDDNGNVIKDSKNEKKKEKADEEKPKKQQQKVVKAEANSPTKNTFSGALVVGDTGDEIKEAKPKQQQQQAQAADQKGKKNTSQKPAQTKEKKSETVAKVEQQTETKTETKTKTPTKKSESSQQTETKTETKKPKQKSEVAQEPKAKKPANKKTDKKYEGKKTKKTKSEEDEASHKTRSATVAQNNMVTPAVAIALLAFAILALYTVFLS